MKVEIFRASTRTYQFSFPLLKSFKLFVYKEFFLHHFTSLVAFEIDNFFLISLIIKNTAESSLNEIKNESTKSEFFGKIKKRAFQKRPISFVVFMVCH